MTEKLVVINPDIFEEIVGDVVAKGSDCSFDKEILNYTGNLAETVTGRKLFGYLEDLCECSELHMAHISEPLPLALNNLKESLVKADLKSAESLTII